MLVMQSIKIGSLKIIKPLNLNTKTVKGKPPTIGLKLGDRRASCYLYQCAAIDSDASVTENNERILPLR